MIWLTWRQFRTQAIVALVALVVVGGALVALGLWMRHAYDTGIATCTTPMARTAGPAGPPIHGDGLGRTVHDLLLRRRTYSLVVWFRRTLDQVFGA